MSITKLKQLKFRAGIAKFNEDMKECTPLPVQGEINLKPNEEESELGFYDFEWKPLEDVNNPNNSQICLILIPGETIFVPITSCTNGRVFSIIFSSNEKYFFWLQEKNPGHLKLNELSPKDTEIYDQIKSILVSFDEDEDEDDDEDEDEDEDEDKALINEKEKDIEMN